MSLNLYDATVPVISRGLNNIKNVLKKGEAWCDEQGKPHSTLLEHRLAPDMLIWTCCEYGQFTLSRVGKSDPIEVGRDQHTFAELYERIDNTIKLLQGAKREDFDDLDKAVILQYKDSDLKFAAKSYTQKILLPNFFFHGTAAYLILRNAGVPLGKGDFLDSTTLVDA